MEEKFGEGMYRLADFVQISEREQAKILRHHLEHVRSDDVTVLQNIAESMNRAIEKHKEGTNND